MKLEELLKLKRFEKPSEAQWEAFDSQLKNKMLLCIVNEDRKPAKRCFKLSLISLSACLLFAVGFLLSSILPSEDRELDSIALVQVDESPDFTQNIYLKNEVISQAFDKPASRALTKEEASAPKTNYIANTLGNIQIGGF